MTLLELAERCEQAAGPDRELDEAIEKALPCSARFAHNNPHAPRTLWNERGAAFHGARIGDYDNFDEYVATRFTASLDAAMTLVPEGCVLAVTNCDTDGREPDFSKASAVVGVAKDTTIEPVVAATPALALCAAALKARANA